PTAPIGAVVTNPAAASAQSVSASITPTVTGSALLLAAGLDANPSGSDTAGPGCYLADQGDYCAGVEWLGSSSGPAVTTSLSAQTLAMTTSGAASTWQYVAFEVVPASGAGNKTTSLFTGKVTSVQQATVTVGWSGTAPADVRVAGQEFSTTVGGWQVDVTGFLDTGAGTATWPSLTPTASPSVTTTSLPGALVGSAYSTTLAATGGSTPYTWAVTSGTLPAGLSLAASTGVISGTPTTAATSSFTVKVTDSLGR